MASPAHNPLLYSLPSCPSAPANINKRGPYHNTGDFSATMALVLLILVYTLTFVVAFTATVQFLLCRCRRNFPLDMVVASEPEKQEPAGKDIVPEWAPTVFFTSGMKLVGTATECVICLAEFVKGERVRVPPACNHGFHVKCVEAWLASCPPACYDFQVPG